MEQSKELSFVDISLRISFCFIAIALARLLPKSMRLNEGIIYWCILLITLGLYIFNRHTEKRLLRQGDIPNFKRDRIVSYFIIVFFGFWWGL